MKPEMRFAVPGTWVTAPFADQTRMAVLTDLVAEAGTGSPGTNDLALALVGADAAGGDLLMVRTGTLTPTILITAWPPGEETGALGIDGLRARLLPQIGADAIDVLDHRVGYPLVRQRSQDASQDAVGATYWLTHPLSGRLFTLSVTTYPEPGAEEPLASYELVARNITWDDAAS